MHLNLKKKIDALFVVAVIIFVGLFYAALQSTKYTIESSTLVTQTQKFLYNLEKVESSISKIETSHRGFIISGNDAFLDPLDEDKKEIYKSFKNLNSLAANKPEQKEKLQLLLNLVNKKIEMSHYGVSLRRKENIAVALNYVSSGKGKMVMDSIRQISTNLEREEVNALNDITNQNEAHLINQNRTYLLLAGFMLIVLFIFYLHIRNNAKKLHHYQRKQDELIQELNYQNRQLDDFAYLTSHNIRSPAVNIYTLISLLNEKSTIEDYKLIYDKLTKVSKNLNETLSELVEVLHVKKNTSIKRETINFREIFTKVKDSLEGDIILNEAIITSDFDRCPSIEYPKTYMESIFHNLLSNALKYRSPKRAPVIHVKSAIKNGKVILQVSDNGLGIDLSRYGNQVFGLRKTFHSNENSKGIGLFMTKTQIETLGGEIKVDSEVNKGTTFTVIFG